MLPRVQSGDPPDFCIAAFVLGPVLMFILISVPASIAYVITSSVLVAGLTVVGVYIAFVLLSVSHLTLSSEGIRFHRMLGSPKFLPWDRVVAITEVSRRELILRGWLWPPFPPKELTTTFTSLGHFKIQWEDGYCYFPPRFPSAFEQYAADRIRTRTG